MKKKVIIIIIVSMSFFLKTSDKSKKPLLLVPQKILNEDDRNDLSRLSPRTVVLIEHLRKTQGESCVFSFAKEIRDYQKSCAAIIANFSRRRVE
ncbi:hypothetical protein HYV11_02080 [Candidatus Dependentiae bacterium]|nr:hypothetical protein [Candidatus Dependentiae bacterium]